MSNECTLTDQELINRIDSINGALCKSGGKSWRLSVPPDVNNDPDLLIAELVKRFERAKLSKEAVKVWVSWDNNNSSVAPEIWITRPRPNMNGTFTGKVHHEAISSELNLQPGECKAFEIRECL